MDQNPNYQNPNFQKAPSGAGFLKVVGILMIIFGAIAIIMAIVSFGAVGVASSIGDSFAGVEGLEEAVSEVRGATTTAYIGVILGLIAGVAELVAGIVGVANCKKPEKANLCLAWGIITAVLAVLGVIFSLIAGSSIGSAIVSLIFGLVMPVLFIIGAVKNKKEA